MERRDATSREVPPVKMNSRYPMRSSAVIAYDRGSDRESITPRYAAESIDLRKDRRERDTPRDVCLYILSHLDVEEMLKFNQVYQRFCSFINLIV